MGRAIQQKLYCKDCHGVEENKLTWGRCRECFEDNKQMNIKLKTQKQYVQDTLSKLQAQNMTED